MGPPALLRMQRTVGNAQVGRFLAQRDAAKGPAQQAPGESPSGGVSSGWEPIYKLIAEQLGEDKFKEHAKTLAATAVDLLMAQVKDAKSEADFVAKANVALMGTMLSAEAKKRAAELASSEAGKALRERLRVISKEEPGLVLAAALAAAAAAVAANADIPELSKKLELAKGLTAEGGIDFGKVQELTVKKASLALTFSSKSVSPVAAGGESGKEGEGKEGEVDKEKKREVTFKGDLKMQEDGSAVVDLGQVIQVDKLQLGSGVSINKDDMAAIVSIKVGDKDTYVSGKTKVEGDGKVSLDLGIKAGDLEISAKAAGLGGGKPTGEASVSGKNLFDLKGFDAKGSIKIGPAGITSASASAKYNIETKSGTAFIAFDFETIPGKEKDTPPIGAQGVVGVGFSFR